MLIILICHGFTYYEVADCSVYGATHLPWPQYVLAVQAYIAACLLCKCCAAVAFDCAHRTHGEQLYLFGAVFQGAYDGVQPPHMDDSRLSLPLQGGHKH